MPITVTKYDICIIIHVIYSLDNNKKYNYHRTVQGNEGKLLQKAMEDIDMSKELAKTYDPKGIEDRLGSLTALSPQNTRKALTGFIFFVKL